MCRIRLWWKNTMITDLRRFESFVLHEIQICRARSAMYFGWRWAFKIRVRIKVKARVEGFGLRVFLATSDGESSEKMRGHSVTLTWHGMHLIECNPGHVCWTRTDSREKFFSFLIRCVTTYFTTIRNRHTFVNILKYRLALSLCVLKNLYLSRHGLWLGIKTIDEKHKQYPQY